MPARLTFGRFAARVQAAILRALPSGNCPCRARRLPPSSPSSSSPPRRHARSRSSRRWPSGLDRLAGPHRLLERRRGASTTALKQKGTQIRDLHRIDVADGKDTSSTAGDDERGWSGCGFRPLACARRVRAQRRRFIRDVSQRTPDPGHAHAAAGKRASILGRRPRAAIPQRQRLVLYDIARRRRRPAAIVKTEKDPDAKKPDDLGDLQLKLFSTLRTLKDDREAQKKHDHEFAKADPSRAPQPFYLGDDVKIEGTRSVPMDAGSSCSRRRRLTTRAASASCSASSTNPATRNRKTSARVSAATIPRRSRCCCSISSTHEQYKLDAADLPGIHDDPLKAVREENEKAKRAKANKDDAEATQERPRKTRRMRRTTSRKSAPCASSPMPKTAAAAESNGAPTAARSRSRFARSTTRTAGSRPSTSARTSSSTQHRLTDPAWINWNFNEFGWEKDNRTLWYVSEETGYSQLYAKVPRRQGDRADERRIRSIEPGRITRRQVVLPARERRSAVCVRRLSRGDRRRRAAARDVGEGHAGIRPVARRKAGCAAALGTVPAAAARARERGRRRRARSDRHAHGRIQGDRVARAQDRRSALDAHQAADLREVLPAERFRRVEEISGRAVRARRRLHAERARAVAVLFPRADVPQPAQRARLRRARHGLPRERRLWPRLAHRDLPADGHARARRPHRRRALAREEPFGRSRTASASTAARTAAS